MTPKSPIEGRISGNWHLDNPQNSIELRSHVCVAKSISIVRDALVPSVRRDPVKCRTTSASTVANAKRPSAAAERTDT
jgi:hypothetical protein